MAINNEITKCSGPGVTVVRIQIYELKLLLDLKKIVDLLRSPSQLAKLPSEVGEAAKRLSEATRLLERLKASYKAIKVAQEPKEIAERIKEYIEKLDNAILDVHEMPKEERMRLEDENPDRTNLFDPRGKPIEMPRFQMPELKEIDKSNTNGPRIEPAKSSTRIE